MLSKLGSEAFCSGDSTASLLKFNFKWFISCFLFPCSLYISIKIRTLCSTCCPRNGKISGWIWRKGSHGWRESKGWGGVCSFQVSLEIWASDVKTPWEDHLLLPRNRQIRLVSLEFSDVLRWSGKGEKTFHIVKINVSHSLLPSSPHPLTFCPLLLQKHEVELFLMGQLSPTFEKVPCHQLHVKIHFTYLKEGHTHRKWGEGVQWV